MRQRVYRTLINVLACAFLAAGVLHAQAAGASPPTAPDSVFARARQMVLNGNGAAGRLLVDSVVAATNPESPAYAEALYWRAALAATSGDAERDYRRLVVEFPLSPRAGEALVQLAELEAARGDRAGAIGHLDRFLLENPKSEQRGRAGLLLVRLAFELGDVPHGCVALGRTLPAIPDSEVELRNQLDYYSVRCANVDTAAATAPGDTTRDKGRREATHRDSAAGSARSEKPKGRYTLQVAAYAARADADRLAKRLKDRGLDVRIVGTTKLFRVRVGHYETRAAATAAARNLRAKKIDAFVTEIGAEER